MEVTPLKVLLCPFAESSRYLTPTSAVPTEAAAASSRYPTNGRQKTWALRRRIPTRGPWNCFQVMLIITVSKLV